MTWLILGYVCALVVILALFKGGNRRSEQERVLEDIHQIEAVSQRGTL